MRQHCDDATCKSLRMFGRLFSSAQQKKLKTDKRGTASLEFAVVATPFLGLLFALIETMLVFFATFTLENGVSEAARQIRTGQAQAANFTQQDFRNAICDEVGFMLDCGSKMEFDVRKFDGFGNVQMPPPLNPDGEFQTNYVFDPGQEGDVVVVRVFYSYPVLLPIHGNTMANMAGSNRLLVASAVFRNEPFGDLVQ